MGAIELSHGIGVGIVDGNMPDPTLGGAVFWFDIFNLKYPVIRQVCFFNRTVFVIVSSALLAVNIFFLLTVTFQLAPSWAVDATVVNSNAESTRAVRMCFYCKK